MPNIDDVIGDRDRQRMAGGPTPSFQFQNFPTPAPQQLMDQYRQEMFSSLNVGSMQAMGLARAQSMNINNPYSGNMGAAAGMAPPWMMTPASQGVFRPGPSTPPLALTSTPGVTNAFTNPSDLSTQYELMRTGMFADPGSASQNYGRMKLHQFGQQYGGGIGTAIGMAATPFTGGIGGALIGGLGQMATENLNNIPGVGGALRWGIGAMNQNVAEQLAWTGGAQHGTLGNVALGPGEMGLGGRGMNTQSAMKLGRRMRQMSQETGRPDEAGSMNQADMLNLLRTAGDVGFLESATNVDQIAKTVGGLMKLVGSLAKITGDPDFRNNLRELGQMRTMGLSTDQGVNALQSMNTWSRMAGMTRGQAMEQGGAPGAQRAVAAGLTPAVGQLAGVHALGQARMLRGTFSETQQALFGDMSQTLTEGQVGFASGVMPYLVPSLLSAGAGGKVSLDKEKIRKMLQGGALDMGQIAGQGAQNLSEVAQKAAEGRAKSEGRELRGADVPDEMLRIMAQMREFKSDLAQTLTPEKTEFLRYQLFQGLQKNQGIGQFAAATAMAGGNTDEAQLLLQKWTNPDYAKRAQAFHIEELEGKHAVWTKEAQDRMSKMTDDAETSRTPIYRMFRDIKRSWQEPMRMTYDDMEKADDELRQIRKDADEARGINRVPIVGLMTSYGEGVMKDVREAVRAGKWKGRVSPLVRTKRTGDQLLSEEEAKISSQLMGGTGEDWDRQLTRKSHWSNLLLDIPRTIFGDPTGRSLVGPEKTQMIESRRQLIGGAEYTAGLLENVKSMTDDQHVAAYKNISSALTGAGTSSPSSSLLAQIQNKIIAFSTKAGNEARSATVPQLRGVAQEVLTTALGGKDQAQKFLEKNANMMDKWMLRTVLDSPNKDAQKAIESNADILGLRSRFDIPSTEEGIKKAEQESAKVLGELGIIAPKVSWSTGYSVKRSLGPEERAGIEIATGSATELGAKALGGSEGGVKGMMASMLVAQEKQGATPEERDRATELLNEMTSKDPRMRGLTKDIREKVETQSARTQKFMAKSLGLFAPDLKGSIEDIEGKFTARYKQGVGGGEGDKGLEAYFKGAATKATLEEEEANKSFGQKAWDWVKDAATDPAEKKEKREQESTDKFDKAVEKFGNWVTQAQLLQGNP